MKKIILITAIILFPVLCYAANITNLNSTFDTSIDTYTPVDINTYILPEHINGPMSAIINIEGVLGTGLKGTQSTLAARLAQMLSSTGTIQGGTSYPITPTPLDGQLFWRTDIKILSIYDGGLGQWQQLELPATFTFSSPSAYQLTLYHNNTAGRTITFPDITDTLVTLTAAQTLTNKTIDDANNNLVVLETSITDSTLLARLAANETVTGNWTFTPASGIPLTVSVPDGFNSTDYIMKIINNDTTVGESNGLIIQAGGASTNDIILTLRNLSVSPLFRVYGNGHTVMGSGAPVPDSRLHIWEAAAGAVTANSNSLLTLENNTTNYLTFLTPNNVSSGILFGDNNANDVGAILYNHTINALELQTNSTNYNSINSSGQFVNTLSTGTAPFVISSATLVSNLNADMVDGYHAGNAWGDVPINNGTVNTKLVADAIRHGTSEPGSSVYGLGALFLNTTSTILRYWDGTSWAGIKVFDTSLLNSRTEGSFAALADNETITGNWTFTPSAAPPFATNSGLLVANLNADRVDGYNTGNGSGNIPISNGVLNDDLNAEQHNGLLVKVIGIGDWNMVATTSVSIAHGLTLGNIRNIEVLIRNDADSTYYPIDYPVGGIGNNVTVNTSNVVIYRVSAGFFDDTAFMSTSYNRGWITIWYVP